MSASATFVGDEQIRVQAFSLRHTVNERLVALHADFRRCDLLLANASAHSWKHTYHRRGTAHVLHHFCLLDEVVEIKCSKKGRVAYQSTTKGI